MTDSTEIRWNDEAREKMLTDADKVLRDAVTDVAEGFEGSSWEDAYKALNEKLKGRFIDYQPGPDVKKYAELIADGAFA